MPALGLLLEHPVYNAYNNRHETKGMDPSNPDYRPAITFEKHGDKMDDFKQKHIHSILRELENDKGLSVLSHPLFRDVNWHACRFDMWLQQSIDSYIGDDFLYLNKTGEVPQASIHRHGSGSSDSGFRDKRIFDLTSFTVEDKDKIAIEALAEEVPGVEGEELAKVEA